MTERQSHRISMGIGRRGKITIAYWHCIVPIVVMALLVGCATQNIPWPKPGVELTTEEFNNGVAQCTALIQSNPNNADAYRCRGSLYQRKSQDEKAIADYEKAVQIAPADFNASFSLFMAYRDVKRYREAHEVLYNLARRGKFPVNQFTVAFLNGNVREMPIEDELRLKKEGKLLRHRQPVTEVVALKQWETMEKLQRLLREKRHDLLPLCWSKGKYRNYAAGRLKDNTDAFIKEWLIPDDKLQNEKRKMLQNSRLNWFTQEDGEWKIDEL